MTVALLIYIAVGGLSLVVGVFLLVAGWLDDDEDGTQIAARLLLAAPVWPIAVVLLIPWLWRIAFLKPEKPTPGPSETDNWTEKYR